MWCKSGAESGAERMERRAATELSVLELAGCSPPAGGGSQQYMGGRFGSTVGGSLALASGVLGERVSDAESELIIAGFRDLLPVASSSPTFTVKAPAPPTTTIIDTSINHSNHQVLQMSRMVEASRGKNMERRAATELSVLELAGCTSLAGRGSLQYMGGRFGSTVGGLLALASGVLGVRDSDAESELFAKIAGVPDPLPVASSPPTFTVKVPAPPITTIIDTPNIGVSNITHSTSTVSASPAGCNYLEALLLMPPGTGTQEEQMDGMLHHWAGLERN